MGINRLLWSIAAVSADLIGSVNPAIILSTRIYRSDIRQHGSHNPGFTNFLRVLGHQNAWHVLLWDMVKSAAFWALFGWLFHRLGGISDNVIYAAIMDAVDLRPAAIIQKFDLTAPRFSKVSCYGHGCNASCMPWEATDLAVKV